MDFFDLILFALLIWLAFIFFRSITQGRKTSEASTTTATTSKAAKNAQMAEDIKATQTSRISDAVEILDELGSTAGNYRHYCELVGTAMKESGVTAPYSGRQVAYYDVKCYRIDHVNGVDRETLVAHEKSIDPFWFKDASCDTPIYVDISAFGSNVILVNSTNHIEGPNSDFSKAFNSNSAPASGASGVTAFAAQRVRALGNLLANKALDVADALRRALRPAPVAAPQFALAGAGAYGDIATPVPEAPKNVLFAGPGGPGGPGGGKVGGPGSGGGRPGGMGQMPKGARDFMGNGYGGVYNIPARTYTRTTSDVGSILVGMTLSSLLRSMNSATTTTTTTTARTTTPTSTFQGYRIVEDVVPLGSPTYCIGEMYRHGTDIYMGSSTSKEYATSFFACRPEAEVLSALGA